MNLENLAVHEWRNIFFRLRVSYHKLFWSPGVQFLPLAFFLGYFYSFKINIDCIGENEMIILSVKLCTTECKCKQIETTYYITSKKKLLN